MRSVAKYSSLIFHPVIFALLIPFILVYRQTTDVGYALKWMAFSSLFLLLTIIIFYFVRPKEFFSDFDIAKKENRIGFYGIACGIAILYFIVAVLFKGIFFPLSILALGIIIAIVVFEIANFYSKVSIHVASACAYVVTIGILYGPVAFLLSWWIAPLVAWSRIYLKKHTTKEAAAGAILGCIVTVITFLIAKLLL